MADAATDDDALDDELAELVEASEQPEQPDLFAVPEPPGAPEPMGSTLPDVLPAHVDLFTASSEQIAAKLEKGEDPIATFFRVFRIQGPNKVREYGPDRTGNFAIENATEAWVAENIGPGNYSCTSFNLRGRFLYTGRVKIDAAPHPSQGGYAQPPWQPPGASRPAGDMTQQIQEMALQRMLAPQGDQMGEAIASIVKMMAASQAQFQQMIQMQMATAPKDPTSSPLMLMMMKQLMGERRNPLPAPSSEGSSIQELMGVLQLGMQMREHVAGGSGDPADKTDFDKVLEIVPQVADSMGNPVVSLLAYSFLPKDKADLVAKTISEHEAGRTAEAAANPEPDPVETEGFDVPQ